MSLMKGVVETASPVQVEMQDVANPVSAAPQAVATNRRTIGGAVVNSDMVPEKPSNTVKQGPYNMHNVAILGREVPLSSHFAPGEATLQSIKAVVEQPWLRAHGCCSGLKPPKDDGAMELMEVTLSLTSHRMVCTGDFSGGTFGVRNGAHGEVPLPRRNFLQQFALSDLVASQITYQGSQGPPGCCAKRRVAQGAVLRLWFFDFPESSSMVTDGIGAGSMSSAVQFSSSRDISAQAEAALAFDLQVAGVHSTADDVANAAAEVAAIWNTPFIQYLNRGGPRIELDDKCIT